MRQKAMADTTKKSIRKRYQKRTEHHVKEAENFERRGFFDTKRNDKDSKVRQRARQNAMRRRLYSRSENHTKEAETFERKSSFDIPLEKQESSTQRRKTQKTLRKEMAKQSGYRLEKTIDPKTGEYVYSLGLDKKDKGNSFVGSRLKNKQISFAKRRIAKETTLKGFQKMDESFDSESDDNVGTKSLFASVRSAEASYDFANTRVKNFRKKSEFVKPKKTKEALKEEAKKKNRAALMKKRYRKAQKARQEATKSSETIKKAAEATTAIAKKALEFAKKNATVILIAAAILLAVVILISALSAGISLLGSGASLHMAGSYQSKPEEIDKAEDSFTLKEMELQNTIDNIPSSYPGYDEYEYNIAEIGHNPFVLISFLSAINPTFLASDMESIIQELFDEMYTLTITPRQEQRQVTDPNTNQTTTATVNVLSVTLVAKDLDSICQSRLNAEQKIPYSAYMQTRGALQYFFKPLDLDWQSYISSYYGHRKNPTTGQNEFHKGIDIAVPSGTNVLAAQDGTVITVGNTADYGNYIVIKNDKGYESKYAHLSAVNVSQGQSVTHGGVIGKTGNTGSSTGSHLHLECLFNGEYYNPIFYFQNGQGTINGTTPIPIPGGGPLMEYSDAAVSALMSEAAKYLGMPYVWGGSSPSTGFDCSGFVSYVLNASGFYSTTRLTAQGLYNKCVVVSASDVKPGDLVFFTGTYNSGTPVSHVGIYCGEGIMIHCGDPIKYTSINTPYWQQHFYAYGHIQ